MKGFVVVSFVFRLCEVFIDLFIFNFRVRDLTVFNRIVIFTTEITPITFKDI